LAEQVEWGQVKVEAGNSSGAVPLTVHRTDAHHDAHVWFKQHAAQIVEELHTRGAILFRGFDLDAPDDFQRAVDCIVPGSLNYRGGTSPRTQISEGVYTSTEYPHQYEIALHNEMSYSAAAPDYIFFACATAPVDRGATPIADCRRVLKRLPADVVALFAQRSLMYERNLFGRDSPFNSWAKAFETRDREMVEQYCMERDIGAEWLADDKLRTREMRPALVRHPVTDEAVWFNQAHLWHYTNSPLAASMVGASERGLPMNVYFGDGSPLDLRSLDMIRAAYAAEKTLFTWQLGDLLALDNRLFAHGRMPFSGPRKIMVAMRNHPPTV